MGQADRRTDKERSDYTALEVPMTDHLVIAVVTRTMITNGTENKNAKSGLLFQHSDLS